MTYYADPAERTRLIAGLRDLAAFLEGSPDVPAPRWADVLVFPHNGMDDENRAEINVIAARIGAETSDNGRGHYTASRLFGPVEYRAVAIARRKNNDPEGM
jgi:hypothetical protein